MPDQHVLQLINMAGWLGVGLAGLVAFLTGFGKQSRKMKMEDAKLQEGLAAERIKTVADLTALHKEIRDEQDEELKRRAREVDGMKDVVSNIRAEMSVTKKLYEEALVSNAHLRIENEALRARVTQQELEMVKLTARLTELVVTKAVAAPAV